jgi:hypothetical protein
VKNELEGSCHCLIDLLPQHLSEGTEENQDLPQSGQQGVLPKFEPSTCQIKVIYIRNVERQMQIVNRCAPVKIAISAENSIVHVSSSLASSYIAWGQTPKKHRLRFLYRCMTSLPERTPKKTLPPPRRCCESVRCLATVLVKRHIVCSVHITLHC